MLKIKELTFTIFKFKLTIEIWFSGIQRIIFENYIYHNAVNMNLRLFFLGFFFCPIEHLKSKCGFKRAINHFT